MLRLERESEIVVAASAGWATPARAGGRDRTFTGPRRQAERQLQLALLAHPRSRGGSQSRIGAARNAVASRAALPARRGPVQARTTCSTRSTGVRSRPSPLLVVSHRPPGAGSTVRSRPKVPWNRMVGGAVVLPVMTIRYIRIPRRHAM